MRFPRKTARRSDIAFPNLWLRYMFPISVGQFHRVGASFFVVNSGESFP